MAVEEALPYLRVSSIPSLMLFPGLFSYFHLHMYDSKCSISGGNSLGSDLMGSALSVLQSTCGQNIDDCLSLLFDSKVGLVRKLGERAWGVLCKDWSMQIRARRRVGLGRDCPFAVGFCCLKHWRVSLAPTMRECWGGRADRPDVQTHRRRRCWRAVSSDL